jgi:hypothetical protein
MVNFKGHSNSPVEGLLPNCTLLSSLSVPGISESRRRRSKSYFLYTWSIHLSERYTRGREIRIMLNQVRQLSCRFPGHLAGYVRAQGPEALA